MTQIDETTEPTTTTPEVEPKRKKAKTRSKSKKRPTAKGDKKSKGAPYDFSLPSPIRMDKPRITHQLATQFGMPNDAVVWLREYAPRGISMSGKKLANLMMKPGASINFDELWLSMLMNGLIIMAMSTAEPKDVAYDDVKTRCQEVLRAFVRAARAERTLGNKHIAAGVAGASERKVYTNLWQIFAKHYLML